MDRSKEWKKPELIVLVRGKPEESVLTGCKYYTGGTYPGQGISGCFNNGCRDWRSAPILS